MTPTSRPQTWLVLGATGFLGRHVLRAARADGRRVLGLARGTARLPEDEADQLLARDLEDPRVLDGLEPDVVINAAAVARGGDCDRDPERARRLNVDLPRSLGERFGSARLVHVSTDLVFGHQAPPANGFRESDEPEPASLYGETKLAGERAFRAAHAAGLVVRLPLLFGDSLGSGEGASDGLIAAVRRGERPRLFSDEFRTPLDVAVAARALVAAANGSWSGLWHVAGRRRLSRLELGLALLSDAFGWSRAEALEHVEPIERAAAGAGERPADTSLDGRSAAALLGFP